MVADEPLSVKEATLWAELDMSDDEAPIDKAEVQEQIKLACMSPAQRKEYEKSGGAGAASSAKPRFSSTVVPYEHEHRGPRSAGGKLPRFGSRPVAEVFGNTRRTGNDKSPKTRLDDHLAVWTSALGKAKQGSGKQSVAGLQRTDSTTATAAAATIGAADSEKKEKKKLVLSMEDLLAWPRRIGEVGSSCRGSAGTTAAGAKNAAARGRPTSELMRQSELEEAKRTDAEQQGNNDDGADASLSSADRMVEREESSTPAPCAAFTSVLEETIPAAEVASDETSTAASSSHIGSRSAFDSAELPTAEEPGAWERVSQGPISVCSSRPDQSHGAADPEEEGETKQKLLTPETTASMDDHATRRCVAPQGFEKPATRITEKQIENPKWTLGSTLPRFLVDYKFWDEWDMWFTYPKGMGPNSSKLSSKAMAEKEFENILFKMGELDSVASFIQAVECLKTEAWTAGAVVSVCRKGMMPKWEAPENCGGGRYMFKGFRKEYADELFEKLAIGLMSGQFHDWSNYNIVSLHLRESRRGHDIQLWRRVAQSGLSIARVTEDVVSLTSAEACSGASLSFVPNQESVMRNDNKLHGGRSTTGRKGRSSAAIRPHAQNSIAAVFGGARGANSLRRGFVMSEADKEAMIGDIVAAANHVAAVNHSDAVIGSYGSSTSEADFAAAGESRHSSPRESNGGCYSDSPCSVIGSFSAEASAYPLPTIAPLSAPTPSSIAGSTDDGQTRDNEDGRHESGHFVPMPAERDEPAPVDAPSAVAALVDACLDPGSRLSATPEEAAAALERQRMQEDFQFASWRQWHQQQMQQVSMMQAMGMPLNYPHINVYQMRQWLPPRRCFEECVLRTRLGDPVVYGYPAEDLGTAYSSGSLAVGCHRWVGSSPVEGHGYWASSDTVPPAQVIVTPQYGHYQFAGHHWAAQEMMHRVAVQSGEGIERGPTGLEPPAAAWLATGQSSAENEAGQRKLSASDGRTDEFRPGLPRAMSTDSFGLREEKNKLRGLSEDTATTAADAGTDGINSTSECQPLSSPGIWEDEDDTLASAWQQGWKCQPARGTDAH